MGAGAAFSGEAVADSAASDGASRKAQTRSKAIKPAAAAAPRRHLATNELHIGERLLLRCGIEGRADESLFRCGF
jgi:hypothetical protein